MSDEGKLGGIYRSKQGTEKDVLWKKTGRRRRGEVEGKESVEVWYKVVLENLKSAAHSGQASARGERANKLKVMSITKYIICTINNRDA